MSKTNNKRLKTACIGQCYRLNGFCEGCGRTNEEIQDWILLTQKQRDAILSTPIATDKSNNKEK